MGADQDGKDKGEGEENRPETPEIGNSPRTARSFFARVERPGRSPQRARGDEQKSGIYIQHTIVTDSVQLVGYLAYNAHMSIHLSHASITPL
jgi:hypothetical protein